MRILQATKDLRKVSLWLGHASVQSTEMYTRADPTVKLESLESAIAPKLRTGRFKASDNLIASLRAGSFMRSGKPSDWPAGGVCKSGLRIKIDSAFLQQFLNWFPPARALRAARGFHSSQRFISRSLRSRLEQGAPLSPLSRFLSSFCLSSPAGCLQSSGVPAPTPRQVSPREAADGSRVSIPAEVALDP